MRIDSLAQDPASKSPPPAYPRGGVADGAVTLDVTADAGIDVSLRFPGVMRGRTRGIRPDRLGWMEVTAPREVGVGAAHRHAGTLVAPETKRLLAVAARAARIVLARSYGVHAEPVVGMHFSRAHPAVV